MRIFGCAFLLFLFAGNSVLAQEGVAPRLEDPTLWTYEVKPLDKNEYNLVFNVEMIEGWHVFSQEPGDEFLIPPTFSFEDNKAIALIGEVQEYGKLIASTFEGLDDTIRYFEGNVQFIQRIKFAGEATSVTGTHRYQVCNDRLCLPPVTKTFKFTVSK